MYLTRNQAYGFPYRGFESHPLRQIQATPALCGRFAIQTGSARLFQIIADLLQISVADLLWVYRIVASAASRKIDSCCYCAWIMAGFRAGFVALCLKNEPLRTAAL